MPSRLLGIDLGTSLIKVCIIDERARCLAEIETPVHTSLPGNGIAEQDAGAMLSDTLRLISTLVDRFPNDAAAINGIGVSGQTAGAMAVDRLGVPITPWFPSAMDTRTRPQIDRMKAEFGSLLFAKNGAWPFTTPRILWWRDTSPSLFRRIALVPSLAGFIVGSISERPLESMAIDGSAMTWYGAANLAQRTWDDDLVYATGFPDHLLPPVAPSLSRIGTLSREVADATGLRTGIPLAVGIGDTVASMVGANVLTPGEVYSVNGSFTNYLVCLDRCLIDSETELYQPLASPLADVWYAILYVAGGGFVHKQMAQFLCGVDNTPDYSILDRMGSEVSPGSDGLTFLPYALGRFCPPVPAASAGFCGLRLEHGRGNCWRSVLEGLTYDLLDMTEVIATRIEGWKPQILRMTGGGARSSLWCQIQTDMLGVPGNRTNDAPGAPVGAALTAGVANGIWSDLREATRFISYSEESFAPDRRHTEQYLRLAEARRGLIERLKPVWTYLDDVGGGTVNVD